MQKKNAVVTKIVNCGISVPEGSNVVSSPVMCKAKVGVLKKKKSQNHMVLRSKMFLVLL